MSEAAWQKRFANSLKGKDQHQLTGLINFCYWMAHTQSGDVNIWKAKAKMAIEKRISRAKQLKGMRHE
jgi:hypothetical protein